MSPLLCSPLQGEGARVPPFKGKGPRANCGTFAALDLRPRCSGRIQDASGLREVKVGQSGPPGRHGARGPPTACVRRDEGAAMDMDCCGLRWPYGC